MDLLIAYATLTSTSRPWLAFVGDGELRPELGAYAAAHGLDRVRFLGFRNQSEIAKYYLAADVLVLPSDYETWGLVINEGMCFGLPVITSDRVGCCADLVREDFNGYVFPTGDVPALANRVRLLVNNAALRRRMGANSRAIVQSWGVEATADGIQLALSEVAYQPPAWNSPKSRVRRILQ